MCLVYWRIVMQYNVLRK